MSTPVTAAPLDENLAAAAHHGIADLPDTEMGTNEQLAQVNYRPVLAAAFDSIPVSRLSSSFDPVFTVSPCPICLEDFTDDHEILTVPCGHCYHKPCLWPWLLVSARCPTCRGGVFDDWTTDRINRERAEVEGITELEEGEIDERGMIADEDEDDINDEDSEMDVEGNGYTDALMDHEDWCSLCKIATPEGFLAYIKEQSRYCFISLINDSTFSSDSEHRPLAIAIADVVDKSMTTLEDLRRENLAEHYRRIGHLQILLYSGHVRRECFWPIGMLPVYDGICIISAVHDLTPPSQNVLPFWPLRLDPVWRAKVLELAAPVEEHPELVRRARELAERERFQVT